MSQIGCPSSIPNGWNVKMMRQTIVLVILVLLVSFSGCLEGEASPMQDQVYDGVEYTLTIEDSDGEKSELVLGLGAPQVAKTFWPDGRYEEALVRPFSIAPEGEVQGHALSLVQAYGDCDAGRCVHGVAMDPETGIPFRLYDVALDAALNSRIEDGVAASRYITPEHGLDFWEFAPLFMAVLTNVPTGPSQTLFGEPVTTKVDRDAEGTHLNFRLDRHFHDPSRGDNATIAFSGDVLFGDGRDPQSATIVSEEPEQRFTYTFTLTSHGEWVPVPPLTAFSPQPRVELSKPCGDDLHDPLLPGADHAMDQAFAQVQEDPDFVAAQDAGAVLLTGATRKFEGGGPTDPGARWYHQFDVFQMDRTVSYEVQGPSNMLGQEIDPGYTIISKEETATLRQVPYLAQARCLGIDEAQEGIHRHMEAIQADEYTFASIGIMPVDIAYRWQDGAANLVAPAYTIAVQPVIYDDQGERLTGPAMEFSLVNGKLWRV